MQGHKKKIKGKKGKAGLEVSVYNLRSALVDPEIESLVKEFYVYKPGYFRDIEGIDAGELSNVLYRQKMQAKRRIKRELDAGRWLWMNTVGSEKKVGVARLIDEFGRMRGKVGYNALGEEIRCLSLAGEKFKSHSRHLCRKYHLPVRIIEGYWNLAEENLKEHTPQELDALKQFEKAARQLKDLCAEIRLLIKQGKDPKTHLTKLQEICSWSKEIVKGYCDKIPEWDKKQKAKEIKTGSNFL
jgi:hypothetical protein